MTPHRFDAPASITRPASPSHDRARRPLVRIAWLIARFVRRDAVRFDLYEQRFGKSIRSFRRDIATIRDAGIYLDATHQGDYRMLCFQPERDAA